MNKLNQLLFSILLMTGVVVANTFQNEKMRYPDYIRFVEISCSDKTVHNDPPIFYSSLNKAPIKFSKKEEKVYVDKGTIYLNLKYNTQVLTHNARVINTMIESALLNIKKVLAGCLFKEDREIIEKFCDNEHIKWVKGYITDTYKYITNKINTFMGNDGTLTKSCASDLVKLIGYLILVPAVIYLVLVAIHLVLDFFAWVIIVLFFQGVFFYELINIIADIICYFNRIVIYTLLLLLFTVVAGKFVF